MPLLPLICFIAAFVLAGWAAVTGKSLVAAAVALVALGLAVAAW